MGAGSHYWYTAPSGTAGNAITFTQAMTLDNSGRLIVGATSVTSSVEIGSFYGAAGSGGSEVDLSLYDSTSSKSIKLIRTGGTYNYAGMGGTEGALYTSTNLNIVSDGGVIKFNTGASTGSSSERARIDSSGNLLVGTTSAYNGAKASINGDIEAHGNFKTHYGNYTSSLTNGSSLTLMTYGNGSYGSPINGILTVFVRDDSGGNLQMTSVLLVGLGGAGAAFTALTTQPYGAGMAFSFGSSASSGSLTIYITNTSGRTATSVNFEFMALYGGANITYAF